ncbi:MAG: hypothetical protein LC641_05015 [Spirochaeta sp.]|nr:hypothetical protein [Spirochaeta sp.]
MSSKLIRVVLTAFSILLVIGCEKDAEPVAFPGLTGPSTPTELPTAFTPTTFDVYGASGIHSMAILVREKESSWLGVAQGLKSMGVPFRIVTDLEDALAHRVVTVYPSLTGANTDATLLGRLTQHVEAGGTLIGLGVVGGGMRSLFGYEASAEHSIRQQLLIKSAGLGQTLTHGQPVFTVQLGDPELPSSGLPGTHYTGTKQPPVALFEDGSAAITHKSYATPHGTGHAYAIGLDIGHYIQRAYNGRFPNLSTTYVNAFQPKIDNILRLLAKIYQQGEPHAVLLSPTPHGREFTALITHDWVMRDSVVTHVVQDSESQYRLIVQADGALDGLTLRTR